MEGIGAGFEFGSQPELIITPGSGEFRQRMPKMNVTVNLDGSLNLEIIDDVETTLFNPGDKFTVGFATTVSGLIFAKIFSLVTVKIQAGEDLPHPVRLECHEFLFTRMMATAQIMWRFHFQRRLMVTRSFHFMPLLMMPMDFCWTQIMSHGV